MKITRLLGRNKITIRRQRQSRQRSNYTAIPVGEPDREESGSNNPWTQAIAKCAYLLAASKKLHLSAPELATRAEALKGSLSGERSLDLTAEAGGE